MGPDEVLLPRPANYRAPTWSWASVDGKLYIPYSLEPLASAARSEAEILVCEATPKVSTLPFGELENARMTMRVKMHPFMYDGRKCSIIEHKGTRTGNGIVSMSTGRNWNNLGDWMQGLLVVRVENEVEQYRRVAILHLSYYSRWPDWLDGGASSDEDEAPLSTVTLI
ncbi:hypothetical protein BJ912DRAFT_935746 [Pholiota molesta]|nr:hypothetical protein BJ912DRAFT_935746 [Pholiota molesta]